MQHLRSKYSPGLLRLCCTQGSELPCVNIQPPVSYVIQRDALTRRAIVLLAMPAAVERGQGHTMHASDNH
jgi:hypothetical protein